LAGSDVRACPPDITNQTGLPTFTIQSCDVKPWVGLATRLYIPNSI